MGKLKKCPFCGGEADIYERGDDFLVYKRKCYSVFCKSCKCGTQYENTEKEAIVDWNRRV